MSNPARTSLDAIIDELMKKYDVESTLTQEDMDDLSEAIVIKRFNLVPIAVFEVDGKEVTTSDLSRVFPAFAAAIAALDAAVPVLRAHDAPPVPTVEV